MAIDRKVSPFYRQGNDWFYSGALPSDIIVDIEGVCFHLHKFPLASNCGKIAHILAESSHTSKKTFYTNLVGCPGGPDAFLVASKFCYGFQVELTPANITIIYCLADYLEMTEKYGENNLLAKSDNFFHRIVLQNWKDCIFALQSSKSALTRPGSLHIMDKLLHALSTMVCTDPSLFGWPLRMYGTLQSPGGSILWNGIKTGARIRSSQSDWWFEDVSNLDIYLFERLIETMKMRGIQHKTLVHAVIYYAKKYLPGLRHWRSDQWERGGVSCTVFPKFILAEADQRILIETIERLLPMQKGKAFCCFLLRLLRVGMIIGVPQSCISSLQKRVGYQLELAALNDLLLPNYSNSSNFYDTDSVERIVHHFLLSDSSMPSFSSSSSNVETSPYSPLRIVGNLIDNYLAEIASDVNLQPDIMYSLSVALPDSSRVLDDGLYRALDIYFKAHPQLAEKEKEKLCSVINCQKLSVDACAYVSQNDQLSHRFALKVLFFEQLHFKNALAGCLHTDHALDEGRDTAANFDSWITGRGGWAAIARECRSLMGDLENMRPRLGELEQELAAVKQDLKKLVARLNRSSSSSPYFTSWRFGCN